MALPLEGLLVVSVEQAVAAPQCTCRLADAGARVIKVERPEGDFARRYDMWCTARAPISSGSIAASSRWCSISPRPDDKALLEAMLAKADVFVQNLKPGAIAKLGFAIRAIAQGLSAADLLLDFRLWRERALRAAQGLRPADPGRIGLASVTGGPEAPARVGVSVVDIAAGMNAYEAILEALIARGRTGEGAAIAISMFDAMADWMAVPLLQHEGGDPPKRIGLAHTSIAPYGVFKTRDGADVLISIQNDREWRVLAEQGAGRHGARRRRRIRHQCRTRETPRRNRRPVAAVFASHGCRAADAETRGRRHRLRPRQRLRACCRRIRICAASRSTRRRGPVQYAGADRACATANARQLRRGARARRAHARWSAGNLRCDNSVSRSLHGSSGFAPRCAPHGADDQHQRNVASVKIISSLKSLR